MTEVLLVDLSGIAHQIWHVSGNEPDPNYVSIQTLAKVRALASQHPHAAVCCDAGKSFRADVDPTYKANRDTENRAPLHHQIRLAEEVLKRDGFAVWKVPGFEADDIIATGTVKALAVDDETTVLICTADKDLLQLVSPRVRVKNTGTGQNAGTIADEAVVTAKFGVTPTQIHDWLCLVGDTSDNVIGARGIGGVTATKLLKAHGSIDAIYAAMDKGVVKELTPGLRTSMVEFRERYPTVSKLITLRTDVPIEFSDLATERTAPPMETDMEKCDGNHGGPRCADPECWNDTNRSPFKQGNDSNDAPLPFADQNPALAAMAAMAEMTGAQATAALGAATAKVAERISTAEKAERIAAAGEMQRTGRIVSEQPAPVSTAPVEFSQQLEPRNMSDAKALAKYAFDSRMFGGYGTEQAVLMVLMAGRELGMTAMASLRGFHLVEGRATLSADLIRALIIRSGKANYFRPTERTPTRATWETQRGDDPPVSLTFTIEEAQQAGVVKNGSGWTKYPADMLTARASAKLARLVYSDIVFNLYDPSEIG